MTATPPPAGTGQNASATYTLHHGDCLDVLRGMADNSVDSVVTDPPYGLSSQRPVESLPNRLGRAFLDVVLPDLYHANVATGRLDKFPGPLGSVTFLDWMGRAIREKSRVCVPVSTLNLKRNTLADQEIEDATKRTVFGADGVLPNVEEANSVEFFGNYILNLRRPPDPSRGDGCGRLFRELGLGRVGVLVVSSFDSELSRFLRALDPCSPSFFADFVGACDDSKGRTDGAPEVVAIAGAEVRAVLALDVRNGALELIPASPAFEGYAVFDLASAQPIGAGARTSCLAPKFKPLHFRFVGDSTNRALTIYLHDAILSELDYSRNGFMGKSWDGDVPSIEIWAECLRVLKPGGHLLAFAGTRTQHRMACRIEDGGFEIRDMLAWLYSTGFPKSMDVSKAIDRHAGVDREVIGEIPDRWTGKGNALNFSTDRPQDSVRVLGGPATDAAKQWQGWGTALKPALETVTFASKPYTREQERDIILSNLIRLESRLWLLSSASAAEKNSTSSQNEYVAACAIAQWSADEITSTRAALCAQMDTSRFESVTNTSLSIVLSWRRTLVENWSDGNTSTTETKSSTTIDLRTLKFSLSQITPKSIIKACSLPGGFSANASTAESHFNASLLLLQSIRTLSATAPAISQEQREHLGAGVTPNLDPIILARKPLIGTVAANVLAHGTGGLHIDACRVPTDDKLGGGDQSASTKAKTEGWARPWMQDAGAKAAHADRVNANVEKAEAMGRWPANLCHDGSPEVVALFPQTGKSTGTRAGVPGFSGGFAHGDGEPVGYGDTGSAARFFYCAKASKRDRDEGLDGFEVKPCGSMEDDGYAWGREAERGRAPRDTKRANTHCTVKPTDLMRHLCRLVTPPGGVVLDPFMGSGSTGKAAMLEGFRFIGIEREAEYVAIAEARIKAAMASTPAAPAAPETMPLFDQSPEGATA